MADQSRKKLRIATVVYWVLLVYVIAALTWWSLMLLQQAETIYQLEKKNLVISRPDISKAAYTLGLQQLEDQMRRNTYKIAGEGATFLLLVLIGAVFIYRSVRQQFRLHLQQQNFVMAISHELKTPIAVSRLNLETLQKYQLDEEKKQKLLNITLQETLRLDNLINNILISAQLEGNSVRMDNDEVDFSKLVSDVVQQFQQRYPSRTVIKEIEEGIVLNGDSRHLKLVVSNLLENAQKYSAIEKPVDVSLAKKDQIELEVADQGEGIPDDEKKNVFKKFYRLGNEKTRKAQGTGLGLFIAKKIIKDHGGNIHVENNLPQGSKFIIQL